MTRSTSHALLFLYSLLFTAVTTSASNAAVTRKFELFHDLGDGFVPRNSFIALTATATSAAGETSDVVVSYSMSAVLEHSNNQEDSTETSCENSGDGTCENVSAEEKAIQELIKSGKFYKIKAVDVEAGMEVLTSVHPCSIRKANFRETINLILSPKADLISLDYTPIISPILSSVPCQSFLSSSTSTQQPLKFTTTSITYTTSTPAMTIPLILPSSNLPKNAIKMLPRDRKKVQDGTGNNVGDTTFTDNLLMNEEEKASQKGFLARYWYILLPLAIMSLFGEAPPEPDQQGQRGGASQQGGGASQQGGGAGVATATAATAAAVGGGNAAARQRRGKRN